MSVPPSLEHPPEVRRTTVPGRAGELAALVGTPPAGTAPAAPVLLVPGYTGSKEDFLPILAPLARRGHRAVAIDLPGQYESAGGDHPDDFRLPALAGAVTAALDSAGAGAHLVGHSFGGLVCRAAVLAGARPRSLALVGSGPAALGGRRAGVVALMRDVLAEPDGTRALADAAEAAGRDDPRQANAPAEVRAFLRERWLRSSGLGLRVMGEEVTSAADDTDALAAVGIPLLVIHGETDDAWPPEQQQAMAQRLRARYRVVAGAAHSPACEAPASLVAELAAFWSSLDPH